eukprot:1638327-Pleurochrysis_carterae.AAC.1
MTEILRISCCPCCCCLHFHCHGYCLPWRSCCGLPLSAVVAFVAVFITLGCAALATNLVAAAVVGALEEVLAGLDCAAPVALGCAAATASWLLLLLPSL